MFTKIESFNVGSPQEGELYQSYVTGLMTKDQITALLDLMGNAEAPAPETPTGRRTRRSSSEVASDAAASTLTGAHDTTAADAAPATGRRKRGGTTEATSEAPAEAAPTGRRRRGAEPAAEPETPKIDLSTPGLTLAATTAVKMIGNPADVVSLLKEFGCENVSDVKEAERQEFLEALNELVVEKTGKPIPGIG